MFGRNKKPPQTLTPAMMQPRQWGGAPAPGGSPWGGGISSGWGARQQGMQTMPMMQPPIQTPAPTGDGWLRGALGKAGDWLGKEDNALQLAGLGLGAFGAYKQGRAADKDREEERRRHEDRRRRESDAAAPIVQALIANLMRQNQGG